jgi:uncharacterized membrane protein YsdA (DUF1294 family)/cold shock CspA family protein
MRDFSASAKCFAEQNGRVRAVEADRFVDMSNFEQNNKKLLAGKSATTLSHLKLRKSQMRSQKPPRYQGRITSWKDDQGFGFITPNGGGPAVFVHIKSFASRGIRPAGNDIVTYQLTVNGKGQPRAENVAFVRDRALRQTSFHTRASALIAAAGFLGLIAVSVFIGKLPPAVLGHYLGFSVLAFAAYAVDKSAARKDKRRTRESTLHVLGLIGGWPGALVAQQILRHKSKKESFRTVFWLTVIVNCGAVVWLLTPLGSSALQLIPGSP